MNLPGGWELILVVVVIMVLFGAKRLPDASRSIGRSLRILKTETKGLRDGDGSVDTTTVATPLDRPTPVDRPAPVDRPTPVDGIAPEGPTRAA